MSALVLLDAEIIAGPLRLTTVSNETMLEMEAAELDATVFGLNGWKAKRAGLKAASVESSGFWDPAPQEAGALAPDAELWAQHGTSVPMIVSPTGDDLGVAYIVPTTRGSLSFLGQVGEITPYSSKAVGDGAVARGAWLHRPSVVESGNGTGSTYVLGTVPAGRSILAAINVLAVDGTTPQFTATIERDDNAGFTSATTVATLGPTAVPTAALTTVAGPITPDDRYRVTWTLTGTGPTARFAVALGMT